MVFKASFQWFMDMHTSSTNMQIIQFSAGGEIVRRRLAPMFSHYRQYKLGKIHVRFSPAATLPVDPTGLSYEVGEQTVDPRDMFNPGLVRHTNGEDVFVPDDTVLAGDSADAIYYSTMLDKRWHKFGLQRGFQTSAYPKWWGIATTRQNMYPGYIQNMPSAGSDGVLAGITFNVHDAAGGTSNFNSANLNHMGIGVSSNMGIFQSGQKIPMGWMPTGASLKDEFGLLNGITSTTQVVKYQVQGSSNQQVYAEFDTQAAADEYAAKLVILNDTPVVVAVTTTVTGNQADAGAAFGPIPEVPGLLTLVLPKAHKTEFYYRVYVVEDVYFKDPVTAFNAIADYTGGTLAPIDVFTRGTASTASPLQGVGYLTNSGNSPYNDGANRSGSGTADEEENGA